MSKEFREARHPFRFKVQIGKKTENLVAWAKVRPAKKMVELLLIPEHVKSSIEAHGIGDTTSCSMAICATNQKEAFPHHVEGYIDWQYRTAFVVSKVDKKTGLPSECFAYDHQDSVARLNDTKGGQLKLLEQLEKKGPRIVRLYPPRPTVGRKAGPNAGTKTGARTKRRLGTGAKLRFATAQLGGAFS